MTKSDYDLTTEPVPEVSAENIAETARAWLAYLDAFDDLEEVWALAPVRSALRAILAGEGPPRRVPE